MTDTNTPDNTGNVVDFARRTGRTGFTLTPTLTLDTPVIPPPPAIPPTAPSGPADGSGGRRSPLDIVAALPDPSVLQPPVAPPMPTTPPPGMVPDTFRSEPAGDLVGPRLGALSLAACLAVAVAALRGTHTVLSTWWENRQARQAESAPLREARFKHQTAMQQIADKAVQQRAKTQVPSSSDFGRKSLSGRTNTSSGSGSGRGGSGSSKSGGSGSRSGGSGGHGSGTGSKKQRGLFNSGGTGGGKGKGSGSGTGSWLGNGSGGRKRNGGGKNNTGLNTGKGTGLGGGSGKHNSPKTPNTKTPKTPKGPGAGSGSGISGKKNRLGGGTGGNGASGGAGHQLNKKQRPSTGTGGGRTSLAQATGKALKKAAARRLKKRRNNPPTPTLWPTGQNTGPNKPGNGGKGGGKTNANGKGNGKGPKVTKNTPPTNGAPGNGASQTGSKNTTKPANGQGTGAGTGTGSGNSNAAQPRKGAARTTLAAALRHAAYQKAKQRLKRRRKNPGTPPIWATHRTRKPKNTHRRAGNTGGKPNGAAAGQSQGNSKWARARSYARRKTSQHNWFSNNTTTVNGGCPQQSTGASAGQPGPGTGPGGYQRSTPFQNASQATAASQATYTVRRSNQPGAGAKTWQPAPVTAGQPALPRTGPAALAAAPTPHTQRPGTTRPKEPIAMPPAPVPARPDPRIVKARKQAARAAVRTVGRQMHAQHETEITLDDACDTADHLTSDAFKTHDQSHKLASNARSLRDAWLVLADDCANDNNLIGPLFASAAISFAESMELVARMSEEMRDSSLEAAEKSETAGNELNDAYRPITQATADAGLTVPSAPVHNRT